MRAVSNADFTAILRLLHSVAMTECMGAEKRRKAKLLIKKQERKYGKQGSVSRSRR